MKPWTRRSLLIGGAVVTLPAVALGAAKTWCYTRFGSATAPSKKAMLTGLYPSSDALRTLGRQYLRQTDSTALASLERLECRQPIAGAVEASCPITLASALEQACREDFQQGRVHCIDGWVLAEAELDVAALSTID
jgi:hypothetical protein